MKPEFTPTLYLRLRKKVQISRGSSLSLGQVAQILVQPEWEKRMHELLLYYPTEKDGNLLLIDMMLIVQKVKEAYPGIIIEHYGQPHVLVEVSKGNRRPNRFLFVFVWLLLFVGSGLAIMNFHADVSMLEVHRRIYQLVTSKQEKHPYLLQIPYSIGLGMGMIIFFNHLFKKKFNEEPSPLEVEMFMYQESLNQYVVTEEYNKLNDNKMHEPNLNDKSRDV